MYALSIVLHCLVGTLVSGAAAAQTAEFRHALIAFGLGAGGSVALKAVSSDILTVLMSRSPDQGG
jgi:hypothetical protein